MYVWTNLTAHTREPSPLLRHLAGDFAERVALLWPAPHAPFLTAGAGQRHLVCIALSPSGDRPAALDRALTLPLKRAVRTWLPDAPPGLLRALTRMGEAAWSDVDYGRLLALLREPEAAKHLNHAEVIDRTLVQALDGMPRLLLRAGLPRLNLTRDQALIAAEAFSLIERRVGPWGAATIADRWARSRTPATLFEKVRDDLEPELPDPPFPGTSRLRPLATKGALRDAALRFQNCLASYTAAAADGHVAVYEWEGPPNAVVQISKDATLGWTLVEARLRNNAPVPEPARSALVAELRAMGVYVGRTRWMLNQALWAAATPTFAYTPEEQAVAQLFDD